MPQILTLFKIQYIFFKSVKILKKKKKKKKKLVKFIISPHTTKEDNGKICSCNQVLVQ
jgi:hypothetical protein